MGGGLIRVRALNSMLLGLKECNEGKTIIKAWGVRNSP